MKSQILLAFSNSALRTTKPLDSSLSKKVTRLHVENPAAATVIERLVDLALAEKRERPWPRGGK